MVMVGDSIADLITRLRNGQMRRKARVLVPSSRMAESVLRVLLQEGFVGGFRPASDGSKAMLEVTLKYWGGKPVIQEIVRQSKSSRRVYVGARSLPVVRDGLGVAILSTNKGILSGFEAARLGVGGEFLCSVF